MKGNQIFQLFKIYLEKMINIQITKPRLIKLQDFLKWFWKNSKAEIYAVHYNDSKQNLRDLLLDADHSRATIGLQKIFNINNDNFLFNWEWTQMEQTASRLIRNAGSWYEHYWVYDGYTNREVLGSSIGPGSNSHYFSINKLEIKN